MDDNNDNNNPTQNTDDTTTNQPVVNTSDNVTDETATPKPATDQPQPEQPENQPKAKFNIEDTGNNAPLLKNAAKIQPYNMVNTIMVLALSATIIILLSGGVYLYSTKKSKTPNSISDTANRSVAQQGTSGDSSNQTENLDLSPLLPYTGTASATRMYKDSKFSLTLVVTTNPPAEGKYYEGWIYKDPKDTNYISLGKLKKVGDEYMLEYLSSQDYMGYSQVTISEESDSLTPTDQPTNHVFHGNF